MVGYAICAVIYLVLLVLAATRWRERIEGSGLRLAIGAECLWASLLTLHASGITIPLDAVAGSEYLRTIAWALVLGRCLWRQANPQWVRRWTRVLMGLVGGLVVLVLVFQWGAPQAFLRNATHYWRWGALSMSVGGLVLGEQVARNARPVEEWRLKYVWLAITGIFAWDAYLYSEAVLHGALLVPIRDARSYMDALLGLVLAIGCRRDTSWRSAAFLSPRLVLFYIAIVAVGLGLLAMAVAGASFRDMGDAWGHEDQVLVLAGAVLALGIAALSRQLRAHLTGVIDARVFRYRYDYRSVWQTLTAALSEGDQSTKYERAATVIANSLDCMSTGVWLCDPRSRLVPASGDLAPRDEPSQRADTEFFTFLRRHEWIYDLLPDRLGLVRPAHPPVPAPPAWLLERPHGAIVVPLVSEQTLWGILLLGRPLATLRLTWEEIHLLRGAARQMASHIALDLTARQLIEARQFETFNRLTAVIMHDLRHLTSQLSLIVANAALHRGTPQFLEATLITVESTVKRMDRLLEELRGGARGTCHEERIDLGAVCVQVVARCADLNPVPTLSAAPRGIVVIASRDRLAHALEQVIRNAQQATPAEGSVRVRVSRGGAEAYIDVEDTGCGMSGEFIRKRLFRPFDSTKGERGMGLGAYQARELAMACGGEVSVESSVGRGTRFRFALPLAADLESQAEAAPNEHGTP